jgi:hypothetical protein
MSIPEITMLSHFGADGGGGNFTAMEYGPTTPLELGKLEELRVDSPGPNGERELPFGDPLW